MRDPIALPFCALALFTLALAGAPFYLFPAKPSPPPPPPPPVTYALHAFDLHGDGYAITLATDLDQATCERRANLPTDRYLYVCREY